MNTRAHAPARLLSTVSMELIVAATGLAMAGFVVVHLAGNLLIFFGPAVFNDYAEKLASIPELLWVMRAGLLASFVLHVGFTIALARANRSARSARYAVSVNIGPKTPATRFMLLSGLMLAFFLAWHLADFTLGLTPLGGRTGPHTEVNGADLELYGLVWNGFANPIRSLFYILAVCALGMHLSHAISSVAVTLGVLSEAGTARADRIARAFGVLMALGFASIPMYVLVRAHLIGA